VADAVDACPDEAAHEDADLRRSDGCPARVVVTRGEIVIHERIFFEYNEATILEASFDLLDEVARVLNNFPEILLVEVQGHADHIGSDKFNLKLSRARAAAVVEHLVAMGEVDSERLESVGYGEREPAVEGRDDEARAANRRVQFIILEDAGVDAAE